MIDLYKIAKQLERMKCAVHGISPKARVHDAAIKISDLCCEEFGELVTQKNAELYHKAQEEDLDKLFP